MTTNLIYAENTSTVVAFINLFDDLWLSLHIIPSH